MLKREEAVKKIREEFKELIVMVDNTPLQNIEAKRKFESWVNDAKPGDQFDYEEFFTIKMPDYESEFVKEANSLIKKLYDNRNKIKSLEEEKDINAKKALEKTCVSLSKVFTEPVYMFDELRKHRLIEGKVSIEDNILDGSAYHYKLNSQSSDIDVIVLKGGEISELKGNYDARYVLKINVWDKPSVVTYDKIGIGVLYNDAQDKVTYAVPYRFDSCHPNADALYKHGERMAKAFESAILEYLQKLNEIDQKKISELEDEEIEME